MPPVVAAAGIAAGASIASGIIGSKSAKSAAKIQSSAAQKALDEQKRVYDIEDAKERERYAAEQKKDEERYNASRKDLEYDRSKTLADEQRVLGSRRNAFGGFSDNLSRFSQGYAPAYGMSGEQTQGVMDARNAGFSSGGGGYVAPEMGDPGTAPVGKGLGPGTDPMSPKGPTITDTPWSGPALPGPQSGSALGSTVWLQAPTGEVAEVPIQDAPQMMQAGAILIPTPAGGR